MWKRFILYTLALCLLHEAAAQSFMVLSNDDFGRRSSMYLDDQTYPFTRIDTELLRIQYICSLELLDSVKTGSEVIFKVGDQFSNVTVPDISKDRRHIGGLFILQVGDRMSKFQSLCRFKSDSVLYAGGSYIAAGLFFNEKANPVFSQDCYYKDLKTGRLTFTGRLAADDFLYEEDVPAVQWEITDEKKNVCGWTCRQAIGSFRGRFYYAWFADQLPSSAGPWKLGGLPGIILALEDSEARMRIEATRVEMNDGDILKTDYPYIKVSRSQYMTLLEQIQKDPGLFNYNHTSRSGWTVVLKEGREVLPYPRFTVMEKE